MQVLGTNTRQPGAGEEVTRGWVGGNLGLGRR